MASSQAAFPCAEQGAGTDKTSPETRGRERNRARASRSSAEREAPSLAKWAKSLFVGGLLATQGMGRAAALSPSVGRPPLPACFDPVAPGATASPPPTAVTALELRSRKLGRVEGGGRRLAAIGDRVEQHVSGLAANKALVVGALKTENATGRETAIILACGMQESDHMAPHHRDPWKTGVSTNVGLFNMNLALYRKIVGDPSASGEDINGDAGAAALAMLRGLRKFGEDTFLSEVRGGESAPPECDVPRYLSSIKAVAAEIEARPALLSNDVRIAHELPYC